MGMFQTPRRVDDPFLAFERVDRRLVFSRLRWLAIVGLLIQAWLLGLVSDASGFSVAIAVLAVLSGLTTWRIVLHKPQQLWLYAVIVMGSVLSHFLLSAQVLIEDPPIFPVQTQLVARILMSISLVTLFLRHERDRPPLWLAGMGALGLPFAVSFPLGYSDHHTLLYGITALVAVLALYGNEWRVRTVAPFRRRQRLRPILLLITLTSSLVVGAGSALAWQRYEKELEFLLENWLGYESRAVRPGFTIGNRLNDVLNWQTAQAEEIALRAEADKPPGYLRGLVFDTYQSPRRNESLTVWTGPEGNSPLKRIKAPSGLPGDRQDRGLFSVINDPQGPWSTIEVRMQNPRGLFLFAPLETAYVSVNSEVVFREDHGTLRASGLPGQASYGLVTTPSPPPGTLAEPVREVCTAVEPELSSQIKPLAEELFAGCTTSVEKIHRVEQWFQTNFEYRLGIEVPRRTDPLTYFLTHRAPAHCEFFATGTAMLLRLAGVPTRYVVGYVAVEKNELGDYWIARHKDAHAWVEAYDDDKEQWVIVESTPEAGTPQPRTNSRVSQSVDMIRMMWSRLREIMRDLDLRSMPGTLWNLLWSLPGLVVLTLALAFPLLFRTRRLKPWTRHRDDSRLKSMHALLAKLDEHSRTHYRERQADETLLQFALQLRTSGDDSAWSAALADCYDLYTLLRFRSETGPDAVERIEEAFARVPHPHPADVKTDAIASSVTAPMTSQSWL